LFILQPRHERKHASWPPAKLPPPAAPQRRPTPLPATSKIDLEAITLGEFAENTCRKDFTPSEIAAIAKVLRPLEERKAYQRRLAGLRNVVVANCHHEGNGKTRDIVARFTGISGRTLDKITAIVEAAEDDPASYGQPRTILPARASPGTRPIRPRPAAAFPGIRTRRSVSAGSSTKHLPVLKPILEFGGNGNFDLNEIVKVEAARIVPGSRPAVVRFWFLGPGVPTDCFV